MFNSNVFLFIATATTYIHKISNNFKLEIVLHCNISLIMLNSIIHTPHITHIHLGLHDSFPIINKQ